jgi:hypothetical protein
MERFNLDEIDGYPKPVSSGTGELWYAPPFARLKLKKATVPDVIPVGWEKLRRHVRCLPLAHL